MILVLYAIFALATGLTACYELLAPVMRHRLELTGELEDTYTTYFTFFLVSTLVAPLVFASCIVPSMGARFRKALYEALFAKV